jgi:flagellar hook protein FlgE
MPSHDGSVAEPTATANVALAANLDARSPVRRFPFDPTIALGTAGYTTSLDVYDANGRARTLDVAFVKTAPDTWGYHVLTDWGNVVGGARGVLFEVGSGTLVFDASGALARVKDVVPVAVTFAGAGVPQALELRFGLGSAAFTQLDALSRTTAFEVDGYAAPTPTAPPPPPPPVASESVAVAGNLDASSFTAYWDPNAPSDTSNVTRTVTVRDGNGGLHAMSVYFTKTAPNAWSYHAMVNDRELVGTPTGSAAEVGSGGMAFTSAGALVTVTVDRPIVVSFRDAPPNQTIALTFGTPIATGGAGAGLEGITQFAAPSTTVEPSPVTPSIDVALRGRLDAGASVGTEVRVYGALTTALWVGVSLVKTESHAWSYEALGLGSGVLRAAAHPTVSLGAGTLRFTSAGLLESVSARVPALARFPGAPVDHTLTLDFGDVLACEPAVIAPVSVSLVDNPHLAFVPARATSVLGFVGNLDAGAPVPPSPFDPASPMSTSSFSTAIVAYDSLGGAHVIVVYYAKTAPDAWDYHLIVDSGETAGGRYGATVEVGDGSLFFDVSGALRDVTVTASPSVSFNGANPNQALCATFGVPTRDGGTGTGGFTQLAAASTLSFQWQDGRAAKAP